ncbi:MAG: DUF4918 family protein [Bacteroidales bacterium]|nr:DUF4918 family protein [Bacteroidales bacterium]
MIPTIGDKLLQFYINLKLEDMIGRDISVLNPFANLKVQDVNILFYKKYFNDTKPRILLLGINPGRFGAGITGIPFTDPIRLEDILDIKNNFVKKPELSSEFIYKMIEKYGGAEEFYKKYILSAVCPLGFVKNGVNINYYDDKKLQKAVTPFIIDTLKQQIHISANANLCFIIGKGKNLQFLTKLNEDQHLFKEIKVLEHPRWVMQYRRKKLDYYIDKYLDNLSV